MMNVERHMAKSEQEIANLLLIGSAGGQAILLDTVSEELMHALGSMHPKQLSRLRCLFGPRAIETHGGPQASWMGAPQDEKWAPRPECHTQRTMFRLEEVSQSLRSAGEPWLLRA